MCEQTPATEAQFICAVKPRSEHASDFELDFENVYSQS